MPRIGIRCNRAGFEHFDALLGVLVRDGSLEVEQDRRSVRWLRPNIYKLRLDR